MGFEVTETTPMLKVMPMLMHFVLTFNDILNDTKINWFHYFSLDALVKMSLALLCADLSFSVFPAVP